MSLLNHHRKIAALLLLTFLLGQWGCVRWHRHPLKSDSLPRMVERQHAVFFVSRVAESVHVWKVDHPVITRDSILGNFIAYPEDRARSLLTADQNREYKQHRNRLLLHALPNTQPTWTNSTHQAIAMSGIERMESIDLDVGATIGLSALTTVGLFAAAFVIILATKSSCPFIYTQDADGYHLEGEVFSGSIYPQLQRHDRLPLHHLEAQYGEYRVRIANKALEIQSTDLLELIVVDHDPGATVLFDRDGRALTFNAPEPPISATDMKGKDVRGILSQADDDAWQGDPTNTRPDADDGVELTFNKPAGATSAMLMVRAKNTFWADHLYGLFLDEFGSYTDELHAMNRKKSAEELRRWSREQNLPLGILLETRQGHWERIGQFELAGPIAWREDAVSIDVSAVRGDLVHLKLETGFLFWEIDQVALDATPETAVDVLALEPISAVDEQGQNVLGALLAEDGHCLVQPTLDDRTDVVFSAPEPVPGKERNLFLHAAGHYQILREPRAFTPNLLFLRSFNEPGAFPRYSRDRWNDTRELEFTRAL